ncbi:MAG: hypothetical protein Q8N39_02920 [Pelolinea sp.]|nr:hypothetical protein [Pelolinea sp.]
MKTGSSKLISFLTRQFDGNLTPAEIKTFVLKKYYSIRQKEPKAELMLSDLERVKDNLIILGWIEGTKAIPNQKQGANKKISPEAVEWVNCLEDGKVINKGIIVNGASVYLDMLDKNSRDLKVFTSDAMESLLKHVEVKRKKALNAFSQDLSAENMLLEGLAISILFSHAARRHTDLRFLNAALKMNDWYYPKLRIAVDGKPLIYYLLALTEQEICAVELLQ